MILSGLIALTIACVPVIASTSVFATSCNGVETSLIECDDDGKAGSGIFQILKKVLDIATILVGIAATIGIGVAGIQYLTAGDNESQVMKAKRRIFNIILGLAAYVLMYFAIAWLLPDAYTEPDLPDIPEQSEQGETTDSDNNSSGNGSGGQQSGNTQPSVHYDRKHALLDYTAPSGGTMQYWLNVPEGATDGMPLIIFLHGSGEVGSTTGVASLPQVTNMESLSNSKKFISVAPVATANAWVSGTVKGLVGEVANEYKVNLNKIYIWGFSLGGVGTWSTVNSYPDYFAAAIPISGCPYNVNAANFAKVKLRAIAGGQESAQTSCMQSFVNQINAAGGSATMETAPGQSHVTISRALDYDELFNWMLGI